MDTQNQEQERWDKNGFPLKYSKERLAQMQENLHISPETFQTIRLYFDAASNLYAVIPLEKLFEIYNQQNPPISQEDFLQAAEIIAHGRAHNDYYILRPEVFYEEDEPSSPMEQEIVADYVYEVDVDDYYNLENSQGESPWYIPPREEFLKYADGFYLERTPQFAAFADYLKNSQRKLDCPPEEICEEITTILRINTTLQDTIADCQRLGVHLKREDEIRPFLQHLIEFDYHTRRHIYRGHTPCELGLPKPSVDQVLEEVDIDYNYQDPFEKFAALGRAQSGIATTVSGKPSRNAPCPCGSGKKYKNCCGK